MGKTKGADCTLTLAGPSGSVDIPDILEASIDLDIKILEEYYLGRYGADYDEMFNGMAGSLRYHMQTTTALSVQQKIEDRAARRSPAGEVWNLTCSIQFDNGSRARITIEDLKFGGVPIKIGGQQQFVEGSLEWKSSRPPRRIF
jgi:hypothetical protein